MCRREKERVYQGEECVSESGRSKKLKRPAMDRLGKVASPAEGEGGVVRLFFSIPSQRVQGFGVQCVLSRCGRRCGEVSSYSRMRTHTAILLAIP